MYFDNFPVIIYDSVGQGDYKDVTNLLRRVAMRSKVKSNVLKLSKSSLLLLSSSLTSSKFSIISSVPYWIYIYFYLFNSFYSFTISYYYLLKSSLPVFKSKS